MREDIFNYFSEYIRKHSGIHYHEENNHGLESRLENIAKILFLKDVEELYGEFRRHISDEMHELIIDLATNNETCFFRDKRPFELLANRLIPDIIARPSNILSRSITIWSAASSTGQEAYSVLMTIKEKFPQLNHWSIKVDATDLSPRVLEQAKKGEYSQLQVQRGLPIQLLQKYFSQNSEGHWVMDSSIRSMVDFSRFNLLHGTFPNQKYDIIFCRNVLIYQKVESKKRIVADLYDALTPGGFLLLGNGETLLKINEDFVTDLTPEGAVYYKPSAKGEKLAVSQ